MNMTDFTKEMTQEIEAALYPLEKSTPKMIAQDEGALPAYYDVSGLAAASMGAAVRGALMFNNSALKEFALSRRLAAHWFDFTCLPLPIEEGYEAWDIPPLWDTIAGLYETKTGWIRLHTNAPAHRRAALSVLKFDSIKEPKKDDVKKAVAQWRALDLETAIIAAGGCAAQMHDSQTWGAHPQGQAVAQEPLIAWKKEAQKENETKPFSSNRKRLRVLDCTRILAGPICTRFLGGVGLDVLRIDAPTWQEPSLEHEVTRGKRCATLDLKEAAGRAQFLELLRGADVFVHGLRPAAFAALGLDDGVRRACNPHYIDVRLNAYGWSGLWQERRGFDSLVQMSCGIAAYGMAQSKSDMPTPLPVQALDHATGYLMAASVLRALCVRKETGVILSARLSLARVAALLCAYQLPAKVSTSFGTPFTPLSDDDYSRPITYGKRRMRHLRFPVSDEILPLEAHWHNAPPLGLHHMGGHHSSALWLETN